VIEHRVNGLLTDFHDHEAVAGLTADALEAGASLDPLRRRAREIVEERYSLQRCLPRQLELVRRLAGS
jgi:glycosyltransferase involved in cell wall biosynthesis